MFTLPCPTRTFVRALRRLRSTEVTLKSRSTRHVLFCTRSDEIGTRITNYGASREKKGELTCFAISDAEQGHFLGGLTHWGTAHSPATTQESSQLLASALGPTCIGPPVRHAVTGRCPKGVLEADSKCHHWPEASLSSPPPAPCRPRSSPGLGLR